MVGKEGILLFIIRQKLDATGVNAFREKRQVCVSRKSANDAFREKRQVMRFGGIHGEK